MRSLIFLSLFLVSLLIVSPFAPAFALRGKLHTIGESHGSVALLDDVAAPPTPPIPHTSSTAAPTPARAVSSSTAQPSPLELSSTAAAVASVSSSVAVPSTYANPLNLTVPFSAAISTWSIRYLDGVYYVVSNNTLSEVRIDNHYSAAAVTSTLQRMMGDDAWKHQQKRLDKHVKRVNWRYSAHVQPSTCNVTYLTANTTACSQPQPSGDHVSHGHGDKHDKHDKHHGKDGSSLMSFYLRQSQCRACVQPNLAVLSSATSNVLPSLASYQPTAMMKWCTLAAPKLRSEVAPSVSAAPLADWEGVCMPAEVQCPSGTLDMSILSPTTCAADEPASKQSCTLCVLDGYTWQTGKRAFKHADNYMGQCVDSSVTATSTDKHYATAVATLDGCPSVVASTQMARQYNLLAMSFGTMSFVVGALFLCMCLRACCIARKNRQAAQLRLTRASNNAGSFVSVAVPAVSSAPTPSAPPAAGYPAAAAAAQQYHEPLLSSGLNPPRISVSSAYPQLQAQRMAVAQPVYGYGRF